MYVCIYMLIYGYAYISMEDESVEVKAYVQGLLLKKAKYFPFTIFLKH